MKWTACLSFRGTVLPGARNTLRESRATGFRPNMIAAHDGIAVLLCSMKIGGHEQLTVGSGVSLQSFLWTAPPVRLMLPSVSSGECVECVVHNPTTEPLRFHFELGKFSW
jgi:hypothetical protein